MSILEKSRQREPSQKKELAKDFIRTFLGKESQRGLSGYAVNRAAFAEAFLFNEEDVGERGEYGKIGMVDAVIRRLAIYVSE